MRSNLGTKSRLAAHILALILLIFMLAHTSPDSQPLEEPQQQPRRRTPSVSAYPDKPDEGADKAGVGTLDRVHTPAVATRVEAEALRPPSQPGAPRPARPAQPAPGIASETPAQAATIDNATPLRPHAEPLRPPEPAATDAAGIPAVNDVPAAEEGTAAPAPAETAMEQTAPPQPDESGAMVVAAPDTGAIKPVAAATPLPNANLEVLGDGVYWLDPGHDPETELAAVPELRRLVVLAPLPGYRAQEFAHVKTEVIPADPADLTRDAADHFIHLTGGADKPVAVAVLPGTRGAAFFKGAYLLHHRAMTVQDMLREITPELDDAGDARDDIIHRLTRLKD
jgi:hypothetical protein